MPPLPILSLEAVLLKSDFNKQPKYKGMYTSPLHTQIWLRANAILLCLHYMGKLFPLQQKRGQILHYKPLFHEGIRSGPLHGLPGMDAHSPAKLCHSRLCQLVSLRPGQAAASGYALVGQVGMIAQAEKSLFFLCQAVQALPHHLPHLGHYGLPVRVLLVASRWPECLGDFVYVKGRLYRLHISLKSPAFLLKHPVYSPGGWAL